MTNLTFAVATFLRFQTIALEETKIDYGVSAQVSNPRGYGISLNLNNHANDSAIDGVDIYGHRDWTFNENNRWKVGVYLGVGRNIEDRRSRTDAGIQIKYPIVSPISLVSRIGYSHEFGDFKGEAKPNAMVTTLGIRWEF